MNDENTDYIDSSTISAQPTIMRYGLIGGLVMIVLGLIGIVGGFTNPANFGASMLFSLVAIAAYVVLMIMAVKHQRAQQGGFITLGKAFLVAFATACIAALLGALFNIIYMGFIDPDYMMRMTEGSREMYEKFGMSEEQIDQAMEEAAKSASLGGIVIAQVIAYVVGAVVGAVIALIVGAVMKKERPNMA